MENLKTKNSLKSKDELRDKFKKNVYLKPDEYLNGWAKKCGWKASLVYDSLWRHADRDGRSFPSIELMAEQHGISERSIRRGLKILIKYNFVKREKRRSKGGKFSRNIYTLTDKKDWKEEPAVLQSCGKPTAPQSKNQRPHSPHKGTQKKGAHKKKTIKRKGKHSSIKDITEQDIIEIAERYKVSRGYVLLQFEQLRNYCEAKGRRYKNYKAALRNFVIRDMRRTIERSQDGRHKAVDARHVQ